jgi:all-trans-retinol 13,14-reductase
MAQDRLTGIEDYYDVVVIGGGLAGLTGANCLAKCGRKVLLLEHHYQLGGLATWFTRKGGHIFDISLHGFPIGMIKSARKYWTPEIANSIVQLKGIRFVNPQFQFTTTFDRADFTQLLTGHFRVAPATVAQFFADLRAMNFYDHNPETTGQMLERYFPGRDDVKRFLMEPIAYANGSTLEDPAITFGIVFSNFMSKGVYTFRGGTDLLIAKMTEELRRNGVEIRKRVLVEKVLVGEGGGARRVTCVVADGRIFKLAGEEHFAPEFAAQARAVRINTSSCQVYLGLRQGETLPYIGDLIFLSDAPGFSSAELVDLHTTSRTFSLYYPETRPGSGRYTVVGSLNARYEDWNAMSAADYERGKRRLIDESIAALERFVPGVRSRIDWTEAATPRTIERYTRHWMGTSFGTKFEGLKVSMDLPTQLPGLYHAGSVGIIMSGWLGTINYGVITANNIDKYLPARRAAPPAPAS